MNVIVDSVKLISDITRDVKFALFEDLPGFPGYIPQLKKGEFFRLYDSNAISARTPELMAVEHTFDAQTKRHTVLTSAYEFIFHQMDEDPPKKKRIVAKLYMETPIGRRAFEEYHSDGTLLAHGHYKTKIYASDLPPWFLYGYLYKRHGFMSAKDVKYLLYKPNYHFDNHLYKYDTLFISYEKPITPMTYDDNFDWFDGYDYVLDGNAMERFLDLVDQYSDCDTSSIRAEMEKKKAWYKERNGNK